MERKSCLNIQGSSHFLRTVNWRLEILTSRMSKDVFLDLFSERHLNMFSNISVLNLNLFIALLT